MRKNRVFWSMLGISAVLHGAVMFGVAGVSFHTPPLVSEDQFVSTLKMIKIGTRPPINTPSTPIEKKAVEKSIEAPPELPLVQEPTPVEEVQEVDYETQERGSGNNETQEDGEIQESGNTTGNNEAVSESGTGEGGTMTDREYEALLGYIKDFIDKNLVYPPMARRRNIEGIVAVYLEIERNGEIVSVSTGRSSGSSILDNAAVSLIKKIPPLENLILNRTLALNVNITYKLTE
jgi:protein TonB